MISDALLRQLLIESVGHKARDWRWMWTAQPCFIDRSGEARAVVSHHVDFGGLCTLIEKNQGTKDLFFYKIVPTDHDVVCTYMVRYALGEPLMPGLVTISPYMNTMDAISGMHRPNGQLSGVAPGMAMDNLRPVRDWVVRVDLEKMMDLRAAWGDGEVARQVGISMCLGESKILSE